MLKTLSVAGLAGWGVRVLQLGSALFVLSDLVLAIRMSGPLTLGRAWVLSVAVWPLCWLGQALILIGGGVYWRFGTGGTLSLSARID